MEQLVPHTNYDGNVILGDDFIMFRSLFPRALLQSVGFEVLTPVVMKILIFLGRTPYNLLKVN
jgi:hypothetical protein